MGCQRFRQPTTGFGRPAPQLVYPIPPDIRTQYLLLQIRALPDAAELRERLHAQAVAAGLKGTILLAEEGINFFGGHRRGSAGGFVDGMRVDERFCRPGAQGELV